MIAQLEGATVRFQSFSTSFRQFILCNDILGLIAVSVSECIARFQIVPYISIN